MGNHRVLVCKVHLLDVDRNNAYFLIEEVNSPNPFIFEHDSYTMLFSTRYLSEEYELLKKHHESQNIVTITIHKKEQ